MFVAVVSKSAWHAVGEQVASQLICVYKTLSETGQVRLASRDWRAEPIVEFNLLSDRRDLERLMHGFRHLGEMHLRGALGEAVSDPFPASYSDRVRAIGVVNDKNRRLTQFVAKLLDGPEWLRRWVMDRFIIEGYRFDQLMTDDEALEDFIRKAGIGVWHASCTCRMGGDDDPMAVTDNQGRVRGVAGVARRRRVAVPLRAVRQHQFSNADDGRKNQRHDLGGVVSARGGLPFGAAPRLSRGPPVG